MKQLASSFITVAALVTALAVFAAESTTPIATPDLVFDEANGVIAIEAEHFFKQTLTEKRAWHITSPKHTPGAKPDADPAHVAGASGGAYVEALPDTRATHDDQLIKGENFTDTPGELAVLHYKIHVARPGRYFVWARSFSTGTEDNGFHIGLDGAWPASGQRWQTTQKNKWAWDCRQRTPQVHTGVPMQLWLDIEKPGAHEVVVAMREDGFELDKLVLARSAEFKPEGQGPVVQGQSGTAPAPLAAVAAVEEKAALPVAPRQPDGDGAATVSGELKQWHKVTLTIAGPFAHERDTQPNPFTDFRLNVTFTHESGSPRSLVPGYFAADGNAAESGAESGTTWRAHLSPDKPGRWTWEAQMSRGKNVAVGLAGENGAQPVASVNGKRGEFTIAASDKTGRDFRAHGRLQYVGRHHLQFAGSREFFLKAGADAPETLLAYADFDGTAPGRSDKQRPGEAKPVQALKTWSPHVRDWRDGDPTWRGGKGKGLIGAFNYLAGTGANAFSFLTYNAGGDGDNVWPFPARDAKLHYDCSKLDQWGLVFDHATARGLFLHFKMQENEMDDDRMGHKSEPGRVPESLDGGALGVERRLYCRELIARFGHALALNWNLGEENTQSTAEIRDMAQFLTDTDPYRHPVVIHTFPDQQDKVYPPLLGAASTLAGASLQNAWNAAHQRTLKWRAESAKAGRPWVVAQDEQNPAGLGVPPDIGYRGGDGLAFEIGKQQENATTGDVKSRAYTMHDIRKLTLWGTLMAGGAGVEYYFGYQLAENDLVCEDWRSRDQSWRYASHALEFFRTEKIPFAEMQPADALIGNAANTNAKFCFAKRGELYLVYLPNGGTTDLDLATANGEFTVHWFNPRSGGPLKSTGPTVSGGSKCTLTAPDQEDWLAVLRRLQATPAR